MRLRSHAASSISVTTPVATLSMRATTSLTLLWDTANPFDNKTGGQ
jgi:hypothetical protein